MSSNDSTGPDADDRVRLGVANPVEARVRTVRGDVTADQLGTTLMHEHCLVDVGHHLESQPGDLGALLDSPVRMEILGVLRRHPLDVSRDNTRLDDRDLILKELGQFARLGGGCLVDCTVVGMGRRPEDVRWLSEQSRLHIVAGTGLYVDSFHPAWVEDSTIDAIADRFVVDIESGIDGTDVRAGIIGEIGTSGVRKGAAKADKHGPFTADEEKALRAAARAALRTGAAVTLHIDRRGHGGGDVVDVLLSEGLSPNRIIAGHMDLCEDLAYDVGLAERGVYVQYDGFGREYYADNVDVSFPKDIDRMRRLAEMVNLGYASQLLVSSDVTLKIDLTHYGGFGYGHLLRTIVPRLGSMGIDSHALRSILVENPKRVLSLRAPLSD